MQIEKSQHEGKWITLETRFIEFPTSSVDPMFDYFITFDIKFFKYHSSFLSCLAFYVAERPFSNVIRVFRGSVKMT